MLEKIYRGFIGTGILLFGFRLVTEIRWLAVLGAMFLILAGFVRVYLDVKAGKFKRKKKDKKKKKEKDIIKLGD